MSRSDARADAPETAPVVCFPAAGIKRSATGLGQVALPYPNGWFAACFSRELKHGAVLGVPFMGQEIVIYRTDAGHVRAIDPYCPHLGAHLGYGGKVDGETLVCPFHGLGFDRDGVCVRTGDGRKPPAAALTQRFVREVDGVVFVWRNGDDSPPSWDVPSLDCEGYSQPRHETFHLQGLCQDMTENSADPLHFSYLHGLQDVSTCHQEDGPRMIYTMRAKVFGQSVNMRMVCHGIGYAVGEASFERLGLVARTQALGTQVEPLAWTFRMIDTIRVERVARLPRVLRRAVYALLLLYVHRWFVKTVRDDFAVWSNRCFLARPKLVSGEANMAVYRRWTAQFYPNDSNRNRHDDHVAAASAAFSVRDPSEL
ncbi:Rieske 2Fe-2S domain-containing protein [Burkholderia sp. BCC1977]|uniref:Rieske 2Fe-2S domain-containing protein n=1 Tax=Burkholderia sp. BCC1977 TaxID=2817440 RepID=UPI002ABDB492|nr:Rieske 2Fe-2S domain-containing protein [Burkholderia sp. BCC1977]